VWSLVCVCVWSVVCVCAMGVCGCVCVGVFVCGVCVWCVCYHKRITLTLHE